MRKYFILSGVENQKNYLVIEKDVMIAAVSTLI